MHHRGDGNANLDIYWALAACRDDSGNASGFQGADRGRHFGSNGASGAAGVRPAGLPRPWLYLDARILGLWRRRLLLGAGNVGSGAAGWLPLDAGLLGICRWPLHMARRLLGTACRLLRPEQLLVWVYPASVAGGRTTATAHLV